MSKPAGTCRFCEEPVYLYQGFGCEDEQYVHNQCAVTDLVTNLLRASGLTDAEIADISERI